MFKFISNKIDKLLVAQVESVQGDFKSYIECLENGYFKDKLSFGISEEKRGFLTANPATDPGALFCGGMGSGKSIAMKHTVVTHFLSNSQNTIYLLYDAQKGMEDYRVLFDQKGNVAMALNDDSKIIPIIEMIYEEMEARKFEFSKIGANGLPDYENKLKEKNPNDPGLARIILCAEEFHTIPNSEQIKYSFKSDNAGTAAYKLRQLMKVGRSYGFTLLAASQRATSDDFPSSLKTGISNMFAFRVSNSNDVNFMGLPQAADIRQGQQGRCAYLGSTGFMQFPAFGNPKDPRTGDAIIRKLIAKYAKPFNAKMLKYTIEDFQKAFAGEGNDGMVDVYPYKSVIENVGQYRFEKVVSKFLKAFDFKVTKQPNEALIAQMIAERDGEKYAVLTISGRSSGTDKMAKSLKDCLSLLGTQKVMIFGTDSLSSSLSSLFGKDSIVLDSDDLKQIAKVLDNRSTLEANNQYEELYNKMPLAKKIKEEKRPDIDVDHDEVDDLLNGRTDDDDDEN